jgi:hypothetical protein
MNPQEIKNLGFTEPFIPAKELKKFRRLYFTSDEIYVIKAINERIKIYLTVFIVALFLFLSSFFVQSVIVKGFLWGVLLISLCGSISTIFVAIVLVTIRLWSQENKLKNLSSSEILKMDKDNFFIDYSDISNIEFNRLPKTIFKNEGELIIVSSHGTYKYIISIEYFEALKNEIEAIKSPKRDNNEGFI